MAPRLGARRRQENPGATVKLVLTVLFRLARILRNLADLAPDLPDICRLLKRKLRDYGFAWGKTEWREGTFLLRPQATRQIATGTKGVVLLGEAAGWISPSSAEGLSYALRSAQLLAEVLQTGPENLDRRYRAATIGLRRNLSLKRLKSRIVFQPALRRSIMKLGLRSMDIVSA